MTLKRLLTLSVLAAAPLAGITPPAFAQPPTHHRLRVVLEPAARRLQVTDIMRPPAQQRLEPVRFVLHSGLSPKVLSPGWRLEALPGAIDESFFGINASTEHLAQRPALEAYSLTPGPDAGGEVKLSYGGVIYHPLATTGEEYQRSFDETAGIIDPQGVFLAGASFWVPRLGTELVTFELEVTGLPGGWDAVSQGARAAHERTAATTSVTWSCTTPAEEVYLVAGPWTEYADRAGSVALYAFLRSPDEPLARKYLEATKRYLRLYEKILPPFPYPSFAVVENFWETGYGMPGFTLLGSKVLRFPWILTSSYPHELLHTWWGNSVFVDPTSGNWCEGLTAYLADHLFAEQRGEGEAYRRDTLRKYTDYARGGKDTPLADFRSRYSAASEAVGYGKSLMLFHMLRRELGDRRFVAALGRFAADNLYRRASFDDLAAAFSKEANQDLRPFFTTWTTRTGAPELRLASAAVTRPQGGADEAVEVVLEQVQSEDPFPLTVPVTLTCDGGLVELGASFVGRTAKLEVACSGAAQRLTVDPAFDVMRRLDPKEVFPTVSAVLSDDDPVYVLPTQASEAERAAWQDLARAWQRGKAAPRLAPDVTGEPPEGNVVVLGWGNAFGETVARALAAQGVAVSPQGVAVKGRTVSRSGESLLLVARLGAREERAVAWVAASPVEAIPGLGRKVPHYSKYSHLAFRGEAPDNVAKGTFEALDSPLARSLGSASAVPQTRPAPRAPLAAMPPAFEPDRLAATARWLADPAREGRGLGSQGLEAATVWVEQAMSAAGLEPAGAHGYRQSFPFSGGSPPRDMTLANVVGRIPGSDPELASHPVLLLAHLDHLGRGWPDVRAGNEGLLHPGADDNASGVAVLLEVAAKLATGPPAARPILVAVTTGEEAGLLGSRHLLASLPADRLPMACLCLDTVGRLKDGGLLALDASSARELPFIMMGAGATVGVSVATPGEKLDSSDHAACLERGVPGVQLFVGPTVDYHRPGDTADKLDAAGMSTIAELAHEVVAYLAGRTEPLHATLSASAGSKVAEPPPSPGARASLGAMPDFGYQGRGVRVAQVMPGSAAELAGLAAGDVVLALGKNRLGGLKDLSEALKAYQPGEQVVVQTLRNGQELQIQVTLQAR